VIVVKVEYKATKETLVNKVRLENKGQRATMEEMETLEGVVALERKEAWYESITIIFV